LPNHPSYSRLGPPSIDDCIIWLSIRSDIDEWGEIGRRSENFTTGTLLVSGSNSLIKEF
jgi:hypothetical protein